MKQKLCSKKPCGSAFVRASITVGAALAAMTLFAGVSLADTMDDEIDYLLSEIGKSHCTFIRNGKRYSGQDARAHIRSKYRYNAELVHSTEEFIEKIASESSMSGKPYLIRCSGQDEQRVGEWFTGLLADYRNTEN